MREEHWKTNDEGIEEKVPPPEALAAVREQMLRTREWMEHEQMHSKKGEKAELVVGEEIPELKEEFVEEAPRPRPVITGWCQCQSPTVKLILGDDGEIKNELPVAAETNKYGVAESEDTTMYKSSSADNTVLYKGK